MIIWPPIINKKEAGLSCGSEQSTPTEEAVEKTPPPALKDTPMTVGVVSKKADLITSDVVQRTVPPHPSGLSFSQQANGLGTRKRTRGQLTREESLDVGGIS